MELATVLTLTGWIIIVGLNNRGLKRAEIQKSKELCVKILEDCISIAEKHFEDSNGISESNSNTVTKEQMFESKIGYLATKFELACNRLNDLCAFDLIEASMLAIRIRDVEHSQICNTYKDCMEYADSIRDCCETIEIAYQEQFFKRNFIGRLWISRRPEIYGCLSGLVACSLLFYIIDFFYG